MCEKTNCSYEEKSLQAQRELSAFIGAVSEMFGLDQARLSAEDWLEEFEFMDDSPRSVTIVASGRLASRLNIARHMLPFQIARYQGLDAVCL